MKIIIRYKERNAVRVTNLASNTRKNDLRKKYPDLVYEEKQSNNSKDEETKSTCTICLEEFINGAAIRKLQCEHIFHANCIDE